MCSLQVLYPMYAVSCTHLMNSSYKNCLTHLLTCMLYTVFGDKRLNLRSYGNYLQAVCHSKGRHGCTMQWHKGSWLPWCSHSVVDVASAHHPALYQSWSVWVALLGHLWVDGTECRPWCCIQWASVCQHCSFFTPFFIVSWMRTVLYMCVHCYNIILHKSVW